MTVRSPILFSSFLTLLGCSSSPGDAPPPRHVWDAASASPAFTTDSGTTAWTYDDVSVGLPLPPRAVLVLRFPDHMGNYFEVPANVGIGLRAELTYADGTVASSEGPARGSDVATGFALPIPEDAPGHGPALSRIRLVVSTPTTIATASPSAPLLWSIAQEGCAEKLENDWMRRFDGEDHSVIGQACGPVEHGP
jgi:hypothetical protein